MTTTNDTPAAMRRRIAKLEALLAEEREFNRRVMELTRDDMRRLVAAEQKLRHIQEVMDEE